MPVQVECSGVVKRFGPVTVLDHVDWIVPAGSVVGVLGGSGAGKTTLLRVIAGLERCTSGRVSFRSDDAPGGEPRPHVGMVFQNLALWPHLTARRHLECVMSSLGRGERRRRAERLLSETRLPRPAWDRRPGELSGGEAQRVALARALAPEPDLLLLDEPLAQVDTPLRAELLELIATCIQARGATALYVTHAWGEAMRIGRRIAVVKRGRIAREGTPEEVYADLSDPEIARLTGPVVEIRREWIAEGLVACDPTWSRPEGTLETCPTPEAARSAHHRASGPAKPVVVRPQQLQAIRPDDGPNRWMPVASRPEGAGWMVTLRREDQELQVASPGPLSLGEAVGIRIVGL